jgi:hypothetical protein
MENVKVCVGLLSNRGFEQQMVLSLNKLIAYSAKKGTEMHFEMATEGYTIAENRNMLAAKSIQNNCTHLLMIDDDMIFPENALEVLLFREKEIIAINYHPRQINTGYMVWRKGDDKLKKIPENELPGEPFECEEIGFGTVLINTDLFHKVERPWFDWEIYDTGMIKTGEDAYFCHKVRDLDIDVWCDPTIKPTGHVGKWVF